MDQTISWVVWGIGMYLMPGLALVITDLKSIFRGIVLFARGRGERVTWGLVIKAYIIVGSSWPKVLVFKINQWSRQNG